VDPEHPVAGAVLHQLLLDAGSMEGVGAVEGIKDVREDVEEADVALFIEVKHVEAFSQAVVLLLEVIRDLLVGSQLLVVVGDATVV